MKPLVRKEAISAGETEDLIDIAVRRTIEERDIRINRAEEPLKELNSDIKEKRVCLKFSKLDARLTKIFSVVSNYLYAASRTFHYMFECTNILFGNLHFGVALATEVLSHDFHGAYLESV